MSKLSKRLRGKDLRSLGNVSTVVNEIKTQQDFDNLFRNIFSHERIISMRAADAVEKLTRQEARWLTKHKESLLKMLKGNMEKELKWHIAQLITRIPLSDPELYAVWDKLAYWMLNRNESRIVRVNSLQALSDIARENPSFNGALSTLVDLIRGENIPSLSARIKKLRL